MATAAEYQPLGEASTDLNELLRIESSADFTFPTFHANVAFDLGIALRNRILALPPNQRKPAVISISSSIAGNHILFQAVTEHGTLPDNEEWVRRKRNAVLRFGSSTWALRQKFLATAPMSMNIETWFSHKNGLKNSAGGGVPDDYAIHGGGFPIRVANVDQVVGVVVVSGLKQEHDHQVIVETIKDYLRSRQ